MEVNRQTTSAWGATTFVMCALLYSTIPVIASVMEINLGRALRVCAQQRFQGRGGMNYGRPKLVYKFVVRISYSEKAGMTTQQCLYIDVIIVVI